MRDVRELSNQELVDKARRLRAELDDEQEVGCIEVYESKQSLLSIVEQELEERT